jgi:hypothetical protein
MTRGPNIAVDAFYCVLQRLRGSSSAKLLGTCLDSALISSRNGGYGKVSEAKEKFTVVLSPQIIDLDAKV